MFFCEKYVLNRRITGMVNGMDISHLLDIVNQRDLFWPFSPYFQLSATNSMHAELIEDDGESRYKVTDIIGKPLLPHLNVDLHRQQGLTSMQNANA